jgi:DNA-binding CsgD family transcriptional regulator
MPHLFLIELIASLILETVTVVLVAIAARRIPGRWGEALFLWSVLVLAGHLAYTIGIFMEVYAYRELLHVVRMVAVAYGVLLAGATAVTPLLRWGLHPSRCRTLSPIEIGAAILTVLVAAAFAGYNSLRIFGVFSERVLPPAAGLLYAVSAAWFLATFARARAEAATTRDLAGRDRTAGSTGPGGPATRDGSIGPPVPVGRNEPSERVVAVLTRTVMPIAAVAAVAGALLTLDTLLVSHRIHDGIHPGFLIRPGIYTLRAGIILAVLLRELGRSLKGEDALREGVVGSGDPTATVNRFCAAYDLTFREREVVEAALEGATAQEIATALFISPKTVNAHLYNVYRKCGVRNRSELNRVVYRGA